jgi:hypothetical protein
MKKGWLVAYKPGNHEPATGYRTDDWPSTIGAVAEWGQVLRREMEAPDLWAELAEERDVLARPSEAPPEENTPFSADELNVFDGSSRHSRNTSARRMNWKRGSAPKSSHGWTI